MTVPCVRSRASNSSAEGLLPAAALSISRKSPRPKARGTYYNSSSKDAPKRKILFIYFLFKVFLYKQANLFIYICTWLLRFSSIFFPSHLFQTQRRKKEIQTPTMKTSRKAWEYCIKTQKRKKKIRADQKNSRHRACRWGGTVPERKDKNICIYVYV